MGHIFETSDYVSLLPLFSPTELTFVARSPGPWIEWRFPLNLVFIIMIPVLIPVFLVSVTIRFSRATRKSHLRVRDLEERDKRSMRERLVSMFGNFEKNMEQAAEDFVQQGLLPAEDPSSSSEYRDDAQTPYRDEPDTNSLMVPSAATSGASTPTTMTPQSSKGQPILSPGQKTIVGTLNKLPRMEKYVACIHPCRNSHGPIGLYSYLSMNDC